MVSPSILVGDPPRKPRKPMFCKLNIKIINLGVQPLEIGMRQD